MWCWRVSSLVLTALLASLCRVEATCSGSITITVSSNETVYAPVVAQVVFNLYLSNNATFNVIAPEELYQSVVGNSSLTLTNTSGFREELTIRARSNVSNNETFEVTVRFVQDLITCNNLLLSRNVTANPFSYTCIPISSCNSTAYTNIQTLVWQRNNSSGFVTLATTNGTSDDVITISTENGITDNTLAISSLSFQSAAVYRILDGNNTSRVLYSFTLFNTPVLRTGEKISTPSDTYFEDAEINKSIFCTFTTFPNATVTWSYTNMEKGNSEELDLGNNTLSDTDSTVNGNLTFSRVAYEDAGFYNCTATNGFGQSSFQIRLRVKNPIRALYPVVGIVASFIVTAIFIFGGYVVRKLLGDKVTTIDQTDYDVAFRRPQSVASDDDEVHVTRKVSNRRSLQPLVSKDSVLSTT